MDDIVKRICYLPVDFHRLRTVSAIQLLRDSGYLNKPENITNEMVEAFLRDHPELVTQWLNWSADKRVSSGWYFLHEKGKYVVGYYPKGKKKIYSDPNKGCAEFILLEVNDLASLAS